MGASERNLLLVVPGARWSVAPIPKVASTLLKRLAVIAAGRTPQELVTFGETRPALAIHRADVHQLPSLADLTQQEQEQLVADPHGLRLSVTRHPGERLLSFWHDKLHLADPAYAPLNASVQSECGLDAASPCGFSDFLAYLEDHWSLLQSDGHLRSQKQWLGDGSLFNQRLDRDQLIKTLPSLLEPLLPSDRLEQVQAELVHYDKLHRQRLAKRWGDAYGKEGLARLERLYAADLEAYGYRLPQGRRAKIRPLGAVDSDALVDPLQQLRDRHSQIAGLQAQLLEAQQQLIAAQEALQRPPLPELDLAQGQWPPHNVPEARLSHFYEAIAENRAQEVLDQTLEIASDHPHCGEIAYLKGLAHAHLGQHALALRAYESAQTAGFLTPFVLFNGANACRALGNIDDGIRLYREAISLNPRFSEARNNLAMAYIDAGQPEAAERELRLLLRDQPSWYQAAFTLANLLRDNKRYLEAIEAFRFCLEHAPVYADAWNNLGLTYAALKKMDEAMASYRQALSINADFKPSRQNLAQALIQQKRHSDALEQFEIFCSLADLTPMEQVVAFQGRITCLTELDQIEEGLRVADGAFGDERLRLIARLHVLPVLYRDNQQVLDVRNRWAGDAKQLYEQLDGISIDDSAWPLLYAHAWSLTNFYLAYQMDDDRPLQELYAGILDRILRPKLGKLMQPLEQREPDDLSPLRVGIISPHLINHNGSIWALGWLETMAVNSGYELFSYNISENEDSGTQRFEQISTYRHLPLTADNAEAMLQRIRDDRLDFLLFTDIGMHPASKIASVLRLASVQGQGWGHPISSGSNTIHYFFSGEGMEPPGNEHHYSEELYRLPRTGLNYERPAAIHDGTSLFEKYNLPRNRPILNSLQSTFKYLPRNDWIFAELAKRHPEALVLLVGHMGNGGVAQRLLDRMSPHFEQRGLRIDQHLRILPRLDYGDFMGLFSISHHTLDTIDWNGGNSSFQSFSLDCPVVTLPTAFMRGRHTVSMLEQLDLPQLIARDMDDYVAISSRLLSDADFYADMKQKIIARKNCLFGDQSVAEAFQIAVETVCRKPLSNRDATKPLSEV